MSSRNITADKLRELLQCSLCLTMYKSPPKCLKCCHTFCDACIQAHITIVREHGVEGHKCPYCHVVSVQSEIKPNVHMANLLGLYRQVSDSKMCSECSQCESEWQCLECVEDLCNTCKNRHLKDRSKRHHNVIKLELENHIVVDLPTPCDIHPDDTLHYMCKQCDTMICDTCALLDHKGHEYDVIYEVSSHLISERKQLHAPNNDAHNTNDHLQELRNIEHEINKNFEKSIKAAKTQSDILIDQIASSYQDIEDTLTDMKHSELCKVRQEVMNRELNMSRKCSTQLPTFQYLKFEPNKAYHLRPNALGKVESGPIFVGIHPQHDLGSPKHTLKLTPDSQPDILDMEPRSQNPLYFRYIDSTFESVLCDDPRLVKSIDIYFMERAYGYRISYGFDSVAVCCDAGKIKIFSNDGEFVTELSVRKCKHLRSTCFAQKNQLVVAAKEGLYSIDTNIELTDTISDGSFSDVLLHRGCLYALQVERFPLRVKAFTNKSAQWKEYSSFDIKLQSISYSADSTLVVTDDSIFVCDGIQTIRAHSHTGAKQFDITLPHKFPSLCAVNASNECLVSYRTADDKGKRFYVYAHSKQQNKITLAGVREPRDVIFQDPDTFWVLEAVDENQGEYKLKQFKVKPDGLCYG